MNTQSTPTVTLSHGYTASADFYADVLGTIAEILPVLDPNERYTAEKLCGKAFWDQHSKAYHLLAGRCLAHMVEQKLLPLESAGRTSANMQLYRLIANRCA